MAHREQHGNREAKKPKKDQPKGGRPTQVQRSAVSEALEAQTKPKH
jgi:hypothetical protein